MTIERFFGSSYVNDCKDRLKKISLQVKYLHLYQYITNVLDLRRDGAGSMACCLALAGALGCLLRLPREAALHGGAPFMAAYSLLALGAGLPCAVLDLALGRVAAQGALKLWRVVPFLRGIGYIKLAVSFTVAAYYVVYTSLACALLIWTAKGPVPLAECRELHRGLDGYHLNGTSGEKCLSKTFLKSVLDDPMWYSIISVIAFTFWLLVPLCLIKLPQSFQKSMFVVGLGLVTLYMGVLVLGGLKDIGAYFSSADWKLMLSTNLWFAAFIQLMFSTHIGFGYLVTVAGSTYQDCNLVKSSIIFIVSNLMFSWLSVFLRHGSEEFHHEASASSPIMVLVVIYDSSVLKDAFMLLPSLSYSLIVSAGIISVLALVYPIVWCIHWEVNMHKSKITWLVSVTGLITSLAIFTQALSIIEMLDSDVIPVLVLTTLFVELTGLFFIYGFRSVKQDLEFASDLKLNFLWFASWMFTVLLSLFLVSWKTFTYYMLEHKNWTFWFMIFIFALAIINFFTWAIWIICNNDDYGFLQKLKSATKPTRKWGPIDPIVRHKWLQHKSMNKVAHPKTVSGVDHHTYGVTVNNNNCKISEQSKVRFTRSMCEPNYCCQAQGELREKLNRNSKYLNLAIALPLWEENHHSIYQCEINYNSNNSCWIEE